MLLRKPTLDRIVAGEVDLVFRRWSRPTVRPGGTLRTGAGMLRIEAVDVIDLGDITEEDARRAGLELVELVAFLTQKTEGQVYRVRLEGVVPDPIIALRERSELSDEEVQGLRERLDRLDRAARRGPWTRRFLRLIGDHPHVRAQDLAESIGLEKPTFKNDVRKLKALGLTISHSPGYELSPRGKALLDKLS